MKLETIFLKEKEDFKKRNEPQWMWDDESVIYILQDYLSSMEDFTEADWEFIRKEGIEEEATWVRDNYAND